MASSCTSLPRFVITRRHVYLRPAPEVCRDQWSGKARWDAIDKWLAPRRIICLHLAVHQEYESMYRYCAEMTSHTTSRALPFCRLSHWPCRCVLYARYELYRRAIVHSMCSVCANRIIKPQHVHRLCNRPLCCIRAGSDCDFFCTQSTCCSFRCRGDGTRTHPRQEWFRQRIPKAVTRERRRHLDVRYASKTRH